MLTRRDGAGQVLMPRLRYPGAGGSESAIPSLLRLPCGEFYTSYSSEIYQIIILHVTAKNSHGIQLVYNARTTQMYHMRTESITKRTPSRFKPTPE